MIISWQYRYKYQMYLELIKYDSPNFASFKADAEFYFGEEL